MKTHQRDSDKRRSLKNDIERLFKSKDPDMWKVGRKICHLYRINYWIVVSRPYIKPWYIRSGHRSYEKRTLLKISVYKIPMYKIDIQPHHGFQTEEFTRCKIIIDGSRKFNKRSIKDERL